MPFDLVPRIITADEWRKIERGLEQRVRALNLFLHDIYQTSSILRQGIVPPELVLGARGYRREVRGMTVPLGVYTHVVGSDLVRDASGEFYVLEDNLRTPSGVSYVVENRRVLKRVWPQIFHGYDVRPVEGYAAGPAGRAARRRAGRLGRRADRRAADPGRLQLRVLRARLPGQGMGVQLVEGSDLFVDDGLVYMRTTRGRQRVDVIYRRVDDDFLDPLAFRAGLAARRARACWPATAWAASAWPTRSAPASPTTRRSTPTCRASSATTWARSRSCRRSTPTCRLEPDDLQYVLEHIGELVVKSVNESGGYGMLIGPHATAAEREEFRQRIQANPRGYIAQPTLALSRHPCWVDDHFEGRHVDLRPFVLFGREVKVTPGGLTRVALRRGSLVVNSSQGGGGKDTWVLADGSGG